MRGNGREHSKDWLLLPFHQKRGSARKRNALARKVSTAIIGEEQEGLNNGREL